MHAHALKYDEITYHISSRKLNGHVVSRSENGHHILHTCVINGQPHIVYPRGLPHKDPLTFSELQTFAYSNRLRLMEERRSDSRVEKAEKHRPWLPILLLTISASATSEDDVEAISESVFLSTPGSLEEQIGAESAREKLVNEEEIYANEIEDTAVDIFHSLHAHFVSGDADPADITSELRLLAGYYSRYREVIDLFNELDSLPWKLKFETRSFRTQVTGTSLSINNATVYFDPQFGAQLKFQNACEEKLPFCVASPADALLHELLHARSILQNPSAYIAAGGMAGLLYPFEHERKTIEAENNLYRSMTAVDQKPRPIRNEHTGRYVLVACSTCVR